MDMTKVKKLLESKDYDFLRTEKHLSNLFLLVPGGSHSYGTNIEGSDFDLRGGCMETQEEILAFNHFEQFDDSDTDTCIYGFKKLITLLKGCNPNVIELLGTKDVIYCNHIGKYMIDNSNMFLSKKVFYTFAGYATAQLRRLENALARDSYPQTEKEKHIMKSLENEMRVSKDLYKNFDVESNIKFHIEESQKDDYDTEIYIDGNFSNVPLRDFINLNSSMNNMIRNYGKLNKRNHKKDIPHLRKHAMHLVRLYYMGLDILNNMEIHTYRDKEHDLLMSIRNGEYDFDKVFSLQKKLERELQEAYETSKLPEQVDEKRINSFVCDVYEEYLGNLKK